MLMSTVDGGVDAHRPVDSTLGVSMGQQRGQDVVPGPVCAEPFVSLPHRLPRAELNRQITPRDRGAIPVDDSLDHLSVITERATLPPAAARQQRGDLFPLGIT
jgi:hypothetical protein